MSDIGIKHIDVHHPLQKIDNLSRLDDFCIEDTLVKEKIGFLEVARKAEENETSDLCVQVAEQFFELGKLDRNEVDCLVVVTQNPDAYGLPHTSAIVHGRLDIARSCAVFDISLGCSGYVYALSVVSAFMQQNGMKNGLLITADPYSKVLDMKDKNTSMIFGDASTVTWLSNEEPEWRFDQFDFGTDGAGCAELKVNDDRKLYMNGRAVFNFSAKEVPLSIRRILDKKNKTLNDMDKLFLHQGSRYIVETIAGRVGWEKEVFFAKNYGNTVSSSLPILLKENTSKKDRNVLLSGFGVGLSWASTILERG